MIDKEARWGTRTDDAVPGPNWGLILSLALVAGAAAYFVPQYLTPRGAPPLGGDAAPAAAATAAELAPTTVPVADRLSEGSDLLAGGRWGAAAAVYSDVAHSSPTTAAAQAGWARALLYANKPTEAIEHAQRAVDLEPRSAEYQALLALCYDWAGNPDRAITLARRAVELDAKLPEGNAYLAEAYTDKFRLKEAEDALERALAAGGRDNPEVLRVQAYLEESRADYSAAVSLYRRAVDLAPERSYLHLSLGHALRAQKDYESAIQAYQRAADLNPFDARAEGGMGMAYYAMEEYGSAQGHLERAVEIDPSYANGFGQLGWLFYVQKMYDKAQPHLLRAVELEKDAARKAEYRHALGWIYLNGKNHDRAREEFSKALELNPELEGARDGLQVLDKPAAR